MDHFRFIYNGKAGNCDCYTAINWRIVWHVDDILSIVPNAMDNLGHPNAI
jgi:hypothetical protein